MEQIEITIPEGWHEVTIEQFRKLDYSNTKTIMKSLCGIEFVPAGESVELILSELNWINMPPNSTYKEEIEGYKIIDASNLTCNELVYLENLCLDFKTNIVRIAAWLYRNNEGTTSAEINVRMDRLKDKMTVADMYGCIMYSFVIAGLVEGVFPEIEKVNNG